MNLFLPTKFIGRFNCFFFVPKKGQSHENCLRVSECKQRIISCSLLLLMDWQNNWPILKTISIFSPGELSQPIRFHNRCTFENKWLYWNWSCQILYFHVLFQLLLPWVLLNRFNLFSFDIWEGLQHLMFVPSNPM